MNKIALALTSAAAALSAGAAYAQAPAAADKGGDVTRAQVQQRTAEMFARLDANKDGKFDAADRTLLDVQRAERRTERLHARFDQLDSDKNGSLSRAEFDAGLDSPRVADGKRGGPKGKRAGGKSGAGPDAEKAMTQAEFTAAALARFDRADTNRDGTVTAAERKAQRAEHRGPKPAAKS